MLQHFFSLESTFQRFRIMIDPVFPLLPTSRCAHAVYRPRWHGWLGRSSEQCIHSIFSFSFAKPRKRCGVQILKLPTCSKSFPTRKLFLDSSWRKKAATFTSFSSLSLSLDRSERERNQPYEIFDTFIFPILVPCIFSIDVWSFGSICQNLFKSLRTGR